MAAASRYAYPPHMDESPDPLEANRQLWEEWVDEHMASSFYDVPGFLAGGDPIDPLNWSAIGDVQGKRVLHLQCHFGLDTLAMARRGAIATGVDFSPKGIAAARRLAAEAGLEADFVVSTVEELPDHLEGTFDVVYTGGGVLCWLGDLSRWGEVIAHFLAPGGTFVIQEGHPFTWIFDNERQDDRLVPDRRWSYFTRDAVAWKNEGSYTGATPPAKYDHHYEWMHTLSDIVMALVRAGLRIEHFEEHPEAGYKCLPFLVETGNGTWRTPDDQPDLPLLFTLRARKDA